MGAGSTGGEREGEGGRGGGEVGWWMNGWMPRRSMDTVWSTDPIISMDLMQTDIFVNMCRLALHQGEGQGESE